MIIRCPLRMRKMINNNKYRRISLMEVVVGDPLYEER